MTLTLCYLTLLLIVGGPNSGQPTTWENPRVYGTCIGRTSSFSIYISPYNPELVIVRDWQMVRISLPKEPGYYEVQYRWLADTIETIPKRDLIVRHGPVGYY